MRNETFLKVVAVIIIMVGISGLAVADPNNPMTEIGIPVVADDFNVFALALQAPQIQPITQPDPTGTDEEKYCWIDWFCPDLGFTDEIARSIERFTISVANFFIFVTNAVLAGGTAIVLFTTNLVILFNFSSWAVFQGHIFLTFFGIGLTGLLGGTAGLWLFEKVRSSIPGMG